MHVLSRRSRPRVDRPVTHLRRGGGLVAIATAFVAIFGLAGSASAAEPIRIPFAYTDTFTDPDVCAADGLVLDVVERVSGFVLEWDAADGSFERATVVVDIEFDIAADNGVTLYERDRIVRDFDQDGYREIGLWEHVVGPTGTVVLDAGQLVFDSDGNVVFEPGRHDFFHNLSSFCPGFLE
jgi:hypothetical protein